MFELILTQNDTFIIGDIAKLLGYIMEWIFEFTSWFGIQNFGVAIVLFTIIVNLILLPLTIKQQKFSRVSQVMNPEIQAIQKKYKDKNDQESLMRMREEMNEVQARYGVSQSGGCLQLLLQMPVFFALWRVISNIPAYVASVKEVYMNVINSISTHYSDYINIIKNSELVTDPNAQNCLESAIEAAAGSETQTNFIVDMLYTFTRGNWDALAEMFPKAADTISELSEVIMGMNVFLGGVYLTDTPMAKWNTVAILIPILAGGLQWLSAHLISANSNSNSSNDDNQMASSMKMMNNFMPIFSAFVCLSMNVGLGIYWIASSGVRIIIQLILNFYYSRIELQDLIARNVEKNNKKRAKKGLPPSKVASVANINTRSIPTAEDKEKEKLAKEQKEENIKKATEYYNSGVAKPGSIAAKAQMVQRYNEKNSKK